MMALASYDETNRSWIAKNFDSIVLGNISRTRRVVRFATALMFSPGSSIPKLFNREYDSVAVYDLLSRPEATPDGLQRQHRQNVLTQIDGLTGTVLMISDTSGLSFGHGGQVEGLGPVGNKTKGGQGFLVHSTIAAVYREDCGSSDENKRPPLDVLGLAAQTYVVRPRDKEGKTKRRGQPGQWNESFLWQQDVANIPLRNRDNLRLVHVNDRESDIYDFYMACHDADHDFVIRVAQNRCLHDEPGEYLLDKMRLQESAGEFELELRARPGKAARVARLQVSFCPAQVRSPYGKGVAAGSRPPARVWGVRIWEDSDEQGAIEWLLLTNQPIKDFAGARRAARIYGCRWVIEEFHKCLKTGLGAEKLQLETGHRLKAAVAIYSVVAVRLLVMRETLRVKPEARATEAGLTPPQLKVLEAYLDRKIETVKEAVYAVARLGGHFKHNGPPGWQTLWHGMKKLELLVEGSQLLTKT